MSDLFRKKSIERVSAPEQLDDYIRVTTPSVWLVFLAVIILVIGMIAFSVFGTVTATDQNVNDDTINATSMILN